MNIPNRENKGSGGDTGIAVESRSGFRSLENIAGLITSSAKKCENETLEVILAICKNYTDCPFKNVNKYTLIVSLPEWRRTGDPVRQKNYPHYQIQE